MKDGSDPTEYVHHKHDESNFACKCRGHFTGRYCEIPYENCGTAKGQRCMNGGTCQQEDEEDGGKMSCVCPSGYGGDTCEERVDVILKTKGGKAGFGVALILLALTLGWFLILKQSGKLKRRYRPVQSPSTFKPSEEIRQLINVV